jgi:asparagine synthase (glutamine-hydrolysing)
MCGIVGYVGPDAAARRDELHDALDRLRHRGPDGEGWYEDDGVILGMCRLAIIGLVGGDQPVFDEPRRRAVVCNGEIYNHVELRAELATRHQITSTSDVAVIPHLHEDDPDGFLFRLRGMFAFALWDTRQRRLVLARDRLGKKPLYWTRTRAGGVAFASELPALRDIAGGGRSLDPVAIHHYLALGMIPGPRTVYRGISALPIAGRLETGAEQAEPTVTQWAGPPVRPQPVAARGDLLLDQIDDQIAEAVRLRLRSDVPIGVMLSGGIDSGLVAAHAAQAGARELEAYVVRTADPRFDESSLARQTATRWGLPVNEIALDDVDESIVRQVAASYGQPFGDSSAVPSWLLSKAIAPHRKVVLNGDGGDEIFAGYRRYTLARWLSRVPRADLLRRLPTEHHRRSVLGFLRRAGHVAATSGAEAYQRLTTDLVTPDLMSKWFPDLVSANATAELVDLLPKDPLGEGGGELMRADRRVLLAWDLLPKMDIATMAHSLEARSPLLDSELVGFAAAIPPDLVVGRRQTKPLLRALARRHLPAEVVSAPKRGFEVPVDRWLDGPLRPLVEATVLAADARLSAFGDLGAVRRVYNGADDLASNRAQLAWALLMVELFLREGEAWW